jgi:pimeloyl-ACP methyl ester carboxylesterase
MVQHPGSLFNSEFHDDFGTWALAYIPTGGADYGEVVAVAEAVGDGDDDAFYEAWMAAGDRIHGEAVAALGAGHRATARDGLLRAACFYSVAYHPLYGEPVDPRLLVAYDKQISAFNHALTLAEVPVEQVRIPFGNIRMPAYVIPAVGYEKDVRPLLILTNGYDATVTDLYFASAVAASRRGYHCLIFDGPGQGELLYKQGVPLRADWEVVITAVVDYVETLSIVDVSRIALNGWSLGGYLAPRAVSGEPRIAACIADPGQWDVGRSLRGFAVHMGASPDAFADLNNLDDEFFDRMLEMINADRKLRWSILQRGFWVNGVNDLRSFIKAMTEFTLVDRVGQIRCPMLITMAENDPLAAGAHEFFDALTSPKTLMRFTAAEGAGDHCEMGNRSIINHRMLDWLDDQPLLVTSNSKHAKQF